VIRGRKFELFRRIGCMTAEGMPAKARLRDGRTVEVRPAGPQDAAEMQAFVRGLSRDSRLDRFFAPVAELSPRQLERLVASPGLSLAAYDLGGRMVAHAQYALDGRGAEFAVVVAETWRGNGLGERLVAMLLEHAQRSGVEVFGGVTLARNCAMRRLARKLGFSFARDPDPDLLRLEMALA
jgi:acetyltransferase